MSSASGASAVQRLGGDEPVVEDDVGACASSSSARAVSRPGSPGPGADEDDAPPSRRRSAPRRRRPAAGRATARAERLGLVASQLVGHPRRAVGQPDAAARRRRAPSGRVPSAWAPTGVSAVGARAPRRRRARRAGAVAAGSPSERRASASPRGASTASAPWPGRGHEVAGPARRPRRARPRRSQPGGGEHQRVALARRRACAAACRRCRAARRPRGRRARRSSCARAAQRAGADARAGGQRVSARAAQRVARVLARRHRGERQAVGQRRRERPWPSARRGRSRRASSARSSSRDPLAPCRSAARPRSPLVVISTISAAAAARVGHGAAWASASALPRVPILTAPAPRAARGARRLGASPGGSGLGGALASPNSSRTSCTRPWPPSRLDGLQADRRLVEQALHDRAGHRVDAREVARRRALPAAGVLGQHLRRRSRRRARAARRSSAARRAGPSSGRSAGSPPRRSPRRCRARPRGPSRLRATTACRSSMS